MIQLVLMDIKAKSVIVTRVHALKGDLNSFYMWYFKGDLILLSTCNFVRKPLVTVVTSWP